MASPADIRVRGLDSRVEDIVGQGGSVVPVRETRYTPDQPILDPNSPLAVQIPEGSDADRSRINSPLHDALASGHVESVFDAGAAPLPAQSDAGEAGENTRTVGDATPETPGDMDRVETPEVHNESEVRRTADPVADVADSSPAASAADEEDEADDEDDRA